MSESKSILSRSWIKWPLVVIVLAAVFGVGFVVKGWVTGTPSAAAPPVEAASKPRAPEVWTCSMHPQIRKNGPGKCPICGMDLIPVSAEDAGQPLGPSELKLSPTARKLAEVQVSPVERKYVDVNVRMVGKVAYDETRLAHITAWVAGRIDRLYVDYTGISVRKGDHMVYLYSPDLITAQEELLQSLKSLKSVEKSDLPIIKQASMDTVRAAREKLRLWGLSEEQVKAIEKRGTVSDHLTIYAPATGIVVDKNAFEGMYVKTGTKIYTIADLTHVWVNLDAYETDLPWLHYGEKVQIETEAYPGQVFEGRIAFIHPVLNDKTRTVKVRVNVPNARGTLKPEMFAKAIVHAKVASNAQIMSADLASKWICPMHPEVVKDEAGTCDICGMPLVRTETLGYVSADTQLTKPPLVIPSTAPLITGKRAVVYVTVPGRPGVYQGRVIELGPRAGHYYIVLKGLEAGEEVVTQGNFKIDSALQIQAKESMMNPEGGGTPPGHDHGKRIPAGAETPARMDAPAAFLSQLGRLYEPYFAMQKLLAVDKLEGVGAEAEALAKALETIDMKLLTGGAHAAWMKEAGSLRETLTGLRDARKITAAREKFALLSESLIAVLKRFGAIPGVRVYQFHCPMAFNNRGADWLQDKAGAANPYFGAAMPECGAEVEVLSPGDTTKGEGGAK